MRSPGGSSTPADDDSGSYPRWCFGAVIILTVTAFISHAAPTEWLRPSKPIQVVAAKETKISDELFAAPSALPHESVMKEVRVLALFFLSPGLHLQGLAVYC